MSLETRLYLSGRAPLNLPDEEEQAEQYVACHAPLLRPRQPLWIETRPIAISNDVRVVYLTADPDVHADVSADSRVTELLRTGHVEDGTLEESRRRFDDELRNADSRTAVAFADALKQHGTDLQKLIEEEAVFGVSRPDKVLEIPFLTLKYVEAAAMLAARAGVADRNDWKGQLNDITESRFPGSDVSDTFDRSDSGTVGTASDGLHTWSESETNYSFEISSNQLLAISDASPSNGSGYLTLAEHVAGDHGEDTDYVVGFDFTDNVTHSYDTCRCRLYMRSGDYTFRWENSAGGSGISDKWENISIYNGGSLLASKVKDFSIPIAVECTANGTAFTMDMAAAEELATTDASSASGGTRFYGFGSKYYPNRWRINDFTLTALGAPPAGHVPYNLLLQGANP